MPVFKKIRHIRLYEVLGVQSDANQKEITKAYRLRALKVHPDKRPDDPHAKKDFQALTAAYEILKDPKRRTIYDETGSEDVEDRFIQAAERYTSLFRNVTEEDIKSFSENYKGSKEEEEDVMDFYKRFNGNITKLLDFVPLSLPDEVERFIALMEKMIKEEIITESKYFKSSCNSLRKEAKKYEKKMNQEAKQLENTSHDALVMAVQANKRRRGGEAASFLNELEAKYSSLKKKHTTIQNDEQKFVKRGTISK